MDSIDYTLYTENSQSITNNVHIQQRNNHPWAYLSINFSKQLTEPYWVPCTGKQGESKILPITKTLTAMQTGKSTSAPPYKKQRHRTGQQKGQDGNKAKSQSLKDLRSDNGRVHTNVTPAEYQKKIDDNALTKEGMLPEQALKQWKVTNDQETFSRRIRKNAECAENPTLKLMQERFRIVKPMIPDRRASSSRQSSLGSMEMVQATGWEDVNEDENEIKEAMQNLKVVEFPVKIQTSIGHTDVDNNITILKRLSGQQSSFSYESHELFVTKNG